MPSKKKPSKIPKKRNLVAKQSVNQKAQVFKDKKKQPKGGSKKKELCPFDCLWCMLKYYDD